MICSAGRPGGTIVIRFPLRDPICLPADPAGKPPARRRSGTRLSLGSTSASDVFGWNDAVMFSPGGLMRALFSPLELGDATFGHTRPAKGRG